MDQTSKHARSEEEDPSECKTKTPKKAKPNPPKLFTEYYTVKQDRLLGVLLPSSTEFGDLLEEDVLAILSDWLGVTLHEIGEEFKVMFSRRDANHYNMEIDWTTDSIALSSNPDILLGHYQVSTDRLKALMAIFRACGSPRIPTNDEKEVEEDDDDDEHDTESLQSDESMEF